MIYILYDTALNGPYTFMLLQKEYPVCQSLFKGTKDEALSDVAPYLFLIDDLIYQKINGPLVSLKAIIILQSEETIETLGMHFRQFIYEKKNDKENYFRFWDARVMQNFLPAYPPEKLDLFFEGIQSFYLPDQAEGTALQFTLHRNKLQSRQISLTEILSSANLVEQILEPQEISKSQNKEAKKPRKFFTD